MHEEIEMCLFDQWSQNNSERKTDKLYQIIFDNYLMIID